MTLQIGIRLHLPRLSTATRRRGLPILAPRRRARSIPDRECGEPSAEVPVTSSGCGHRDCEAVGVGS